MASKSRTRTRALSSAEDVARMVAQQDQQDQQEEPAEAPPVEPVKPPAPVTDVMPPAVLLSAPAGLQDAPPPWDPGKVDGRTLRRTGREPFATRVKPETHEALRRIAYHRRITIAEALEMAVAAFDRG